MLNFKNKKGELTTTQLVTLIILIVSFIVILFLLFRLNLGQTTDAEICKNSVVLRGQSKLTSGPLDCKTQYVCISGGEDCGDFSAIEKITVDSGNKTQVMKAIADEMAECWNTFGEGKISYGGGAFATRVSYAICSTISFDILVQDKIKEISYGEFYAYLKDAKKSQSQTYLQYLYGISEVNAFTPESQIKVDISQDKILTNQRYSVITGVDNNILEPIDDDVILKVYIIPTDEINSRLAGKKEFLTKA